MSTPRTTSLSNYMLIVQQIVAKSFSCGRKHKNWYGYSFGTTILKKARSPFKNSIWQPFYEREQRMCATVPICCDLSLLAGSHKSSDRKYQDYIQICTNSIVVSNWRILVNHPILILRSSTLWPML